MSSLHKLRVVALLEGASFLLLLFVAMPLKYMAGMPMFVRVVGSIHGLLFVAFMVLLFQARIERRWRIQRVALAFVSALVPLATFAFDRSLRRELETSRAA